MNVFITYRIGDLAFDIAAEVSPYYPAIVGGPPERCSPAEGGEVEITSITLNGLDASELYEALNLATQRAIGDACFEAAQ